MKRYSYFLTAMLAMGMALVACNKEQNAVVDQPEAEQTPVSFGAYVNRSTTKAGLVCDSLLISDLQRNAPGTGSGNRGIVGFGVFAYYTNADNYDQSFTPNFMYNQRIIYSGSATTGWQYSPIKYWPNEYGTNAYSDDADKVSFFAYAPYVSVNSSSGKVNGDGNITTSYADDNGDTNYGIVGMKRNNATGDPMIQYKVSAFTNEQVDLVWGVSASSSNWDLKNTGHQTLVAGKPFLNMQHPDATSTDWQSAQKVAFEFQHSLAKLFVTVDTKTNSTSPAAPAGDTKVFIRSVTFEGFDTKGALNLNNTEANKALWYNFDCSNELNNGAEFTIYDGRKDGKEGLTASTKEYAAINPVFVQDADWDHTMEGVINTPRNLFAMRGYLHSANGRAPILVIPNNDPLKVTIEYDVLTKDPRLAGMLNDGVTAGSVVKNVITRYITASAGTSGWGSVTEPTAANAIRLECGKKYTIALHLGLNSVEFDAAVTGWVSDGAGAADLPQNN